MNTANSINYVLINNGRVCSEEQFLKETGFGVEVQAQNQEVGKMFNFAKGSTILEKTIVDPETEKILVLKEVNKVKFNPKARIKVYFNTDEYLFGTNSTTWPSPCVEIIRCSKKNLLERLVESGSVTQNKKKEKAPEVNISFSLEIEEKKNSPYEEYAQMLPYATQPVYKKMATLIQKLKGLENLSQEERDNLVMDFEVLNGRIRTFHERFSLLGDIEMEKLLHQSVLNRLQTIEKAVSLGEKKEEIKAGREKLKEKYKEIKCISPYEKYAKMLPLDCRGINLREIYRSMLALLEEIDKHPGFPQEKRRKLIHDFNAFNSLLNEWHKIKGGFFDEGDRNLLRQNLITDHGIIAKAIELHRLNKRVEELEKNQQKKPKKEVEGANEKNNNTSSSEEENEWESIL